MKKRVKIINIFVILISLLIIFLSFSLNIHAEDDENVVLYNFTRFYEYTGEEIKINDLVLTYNGETLVENVDYEISYPEDCTSVGTKEATLSLIDEDEFYVFSGEERQESIYYYICDKYIDLSDYGITDGMVVELEDGNASPFSALETAYEDYISITDGTLSSVGDATTTISFTDSTKRVIIGYRDSYNSFYYYDSKSNDSFDINWSTVRYKFTENDERIRVRDLENIGYTIGSETPLSWSGNVDFGDTLQLGTDYDVYLYIPELYGDETEVISLSEEEANGSVYDLILQIVFKGDYGGYVNKTIKLCPSIDSSEVVLLDGATQDGENIVFQYGLTTPPFKLTMDINGEIKTLVYGTDFDVDSFYLFYGVGSSYQLEATGIGDYAGSIEISCILTAKDINDESMRYEADSNAYYSGEDTVLGIRIYDDNYGNEYTIDSSNYDISYVFDTDNNMGTATITGTGNYTGSFDVDFTLANRRWADLSWEVEWDAEYKGYDALFYSSSERIPSVVLKYENEVLNEGVDYELSLTDWNTTDILNLVINLKGNYYGTGYLPFYVIPATVEGIEPYVILDGTEATFDLVVKDINNNLLTENEDYTISYENNTECGTATYIINLNGDNITGTFKVVNKEITEDDSLLNVIGVNDTDYYIGQHQTIDLSSSLVYYNEVLLTKNTDYTCETFVKDNDGINHYYNGNSGLTNEDSNGQVYNIYFTITFIGNYYGTVTYEAKAKPSIENATIEALDDARNDENTLYYTYNGSVIEPIFNLTLLIDGYPVTLVYGTDFSLGEDEEYSGKNVGFYQVLIYGINNYGGAFYLNYYIEAIDASNLTIEGDIEYAILSGDTATINPIIKDPSDNILIEGTDYTISFENNDSLGTASYTITFTNENISGEPISGEFRVVNKEITLDDSLLSVQYLDNGSYSLTMPTTYMPNPEVYYDNVLLIKNTDYTITTVVRDEDDNVLTYGSQPGIQAEYANGKVYSATTTITFINEYAGSVSYQSLLVPRLDSATIVPTDGAEFDSLSNKLIYEYTGNVIVPEFVLEFEVDGEVKTLTLGTDFEVEQSDEFKEISNEYYLYVNGINNYGGSIYVMLEIKAKNIESDDISVEHEEHFYLHDDEYQFGLRIYDETFEYELIKDTDYELNYETNGDNVTVYISGINQYSGEIQFDVLLASYLLIIQNVNIEYDTTYDDHNAMYYTGSSVYPTFTINYNDNELVLNEDYSVTYEGDFETFGSTITIKIKGLNEYYGTIEIEYILYSPILEELEIPYIGNKSIDYLLEQNDILNYFDNVEEGNVAGVGTYTFAATLKPGHVFKDGDNYSLEGNFIINIVEYDIVDNISFEPAPEQEYTGEEFKPELTITDNYGNQLVEDTDYELEYSDNTNAGTATITIKGINNYKGSVETEFNITPISSATLDVRVGDYVLVEAITADGVKPNLIIEDLNGNSLVEGTDYDLELTNNTEYGSASYLITFKNNYDGSYEGSFYIAKYYVLLNDYDIDFENIGIEIENGEASLANYFNKLNEAYGDYVTITNATQTGAGSYSSTISFEPEVYAVYKFDSEFTEYINDYEFEWSAYKHIFEGEDSDLEITGLYNQGYYFGRNTVSSWNGSVSYKEEELIAGTDYNSSTIITDIDGNEYSYDSNKSGIKAEDANGTVYIATVRIDFIGDYSGYVITSYQLCPDIENFDVSSNEGLEYDSAFTYDYNGSEIIPDFDLVYNYNGTVFVLKKDIDFEFSESTVYGTLPKESPYEIVLKGIGDYAGSHYIYYYIQGKSLNDENIKYEAESTAYYDEASNPHTNLAIELNDETLEYKLILDTDYEISYTYDLDNLTGIATISGIGNYRGSFEVSFALSTKKMSDLNINISYDGTYNDYNCMYYNGTNVYPSIEIKDGDTLLEEDVDYKVTFEGNSIDYDGTVNILIESLNSNYYGNLEYDYIIHSAIFDETEIEIEYHGSMHFDTVMLENEIMDFIKGYDETELTNIGDYQINVTLNDGYVFYDGENYSLEGIINVKVVEYDIEDSISFEPASEQEYTGKELKPELTITDYNDNTLTLGTDYELEYSDNINAGTAIILIKGINNYKGSVETTFSILKLDSLTLDINVGEYVIAEELTADGVKPEIVIKDSNDNLLVENTDYDLELTNNTEYGSASYLITFKNNYEGSYEGSFYIAKYYVLLNDYDVDFNNIIIEIENGEASLDKYFEKLNNLYGDYIHISNTTAAAVGSYEASISFDSELYTVLYYEDDDFYDHLIENNFYWRAVLHNIVDSNDPNLRIEGLENQGYVYNEGRSFGFSGSIYYNDVKLRPETDVLYSFSVLDLEGNEHYYESYTPGIIAAEADGTKYIGRLYIEFGGEYGGSLVIDVDILPSIEQAVVSMLDEHEYIDNFATYEYNGESIIPEFNLIINNTDVTYTLNYKEDFDYEIIESIEPGRYELILFGINNYAGHLMFNYEIVGKDINTDRFSYESSDNFYINYSDGSYQFEFELKEIANDYILIKDTDYEISYEDIDDIVVVYIRGINHYSGEILIDKVLATGLVEDLSFNIDYDSVYEESNIMYFTNDYNYPVIKVLSPDGNELVADEDYRISYNGDFTIYGNEINFKIEFINLYYGIYEDSFIIKSEEIEEISFDYRGRANISDLISESDYNLMFESYDELEILYIGVYRINAKTNKGYIIKNDDNYYLEGQLKINIIQNEDANIEDVIGEAAEEIIASSTKSVDINLDEINFEDLTGLSKDELIQAKAFYDDLESFVIDNKLDEAVNNNLASLGYDVELTVEQVAERLKAYLDEYAINSGYDNFGSQVDDAINAVTVEEEKTITKEELEAFIHRHNKVTTIEKLHQVVEDKKEELDQIYYEKCTDDGLRQTYFDEVKEKVHEIKNVTIIIVKHTQSQAIANNNIEDYYNELKDSGKYNEEQLQLLKEVFDEMQERVSNLFAADNVDDQLVIQDELDQIVKDAIEKLTKVNISNTSTDENSEVQGSVTSSAGMDGKTNLIIEKTATNVSILLSKAINNNKVTGEDNALLLIKNKDVKEAYDINLEIDGVKETDFNGEYIVKLLLTDDLKAYNNLQIVYISEDGYVEVCNTYIEGEYLVFKTTHFSTYYLLGDKLVDFAPYIKILLAVIASLIILIVYLILKIKNKKINEIGLVLSCFLVPLSSIISINVLAVTIALGIVAFILLIIAILLLIKDYKIDRRLGDEE